MAIKHIVFYSWLHFTSVTGGFLCSSPHTQTAAGILIITNGKNLSYFSSLPTF